jgi:SHS2 domain-containing protein
MWLLGLGKGLNNKEQSCFMYRFIDHTADIAFEVFGSKLSELIESATMAFYDAFILLELLENGEEEKIEVQADSPDYLLLKWLNELLYLFDTKFFAAKHAEIDVKDFYARGVLKGGTFNPEMVKVEPKAITLHNFRVEKRNGWYAFVVVDI